MPIELGARAFEQLAEIETHRPAARQQCQRSFGDGVRGGNGRAVRRTEQSLRTVGHERFRGYELARRACVQLREAFAVQLTVDHGAQMNEQALAKAAVAQE